MGDHGPVVLFPYVGDSIGGSHRSSLSLVQTLANQGRFQPLVALHQSGPLEGELTARSIPWIAAPDFGALAGSSRLRQVLDLVRSTQHGGAFLREQQVALVHTNDSRMHRAWNWIATREGLPHLWHQRNAGLSLIMQQIARRADAIVAVSDFTKSTLPGHLQRKTSVIDNAFTDTGWASRRNEAGSRLHRTFGIDDDVPIVGFVGSFIERKCPVTFVEMAGILREWGVSAHFLMFGAPGPQSTFTHERIDHLGLRNVVTDAGFASPIEPILAGMDVLVAPAVREPFARSIIEAMMTKTATIASDEGGNLEIISNGDTGVLVPAGDARAFAEATRTLLSDPRLRETLSDKAYAVVTRRFSSERHASAISEIYDHLLRQDRR